MTLKHGSDGQTTPTTTDSASGEEDFNLKIGIGIPETGKVEAGTAMSLVALTNHFMSSRYDGGTKYIYPIFMECSMLPEARHGIVKEAINSECTHLLWIDSDMVFQPDLLNVLLSHNLPIVGVNYVRRGLPTRPTATAIEGGLLYTEDDSEGLAEVQHLGFGCLLTDIRVYNEVDLPFFQFEVMKNKFGFRGEDVYFCNKLRKAGIKIYCDQKLSRQIGHIGEFIHFHEHASLGKDMGVVAKEDLKDGHNERHRA